MIVSTPPLRGTKQDTDKWLEELQQNINGMLEFGDNIAGNFITVNFVAGVSQAIPHGLGQVPYGYLVMYKFGAGDIFRPIGGAWDATTITLQCTTTIQANIFVVGCVKRR